MGAYPEFTGVGARALGVLWLDHAFITVATAAGGCPEGKTAAVGTTGGPEAAEGGPTAPEADGDGPPAAESGAAPAWLPGDGSTILRRLGGGALGAPARTLGAIKDPLRGGATELLTGVTVVVTTRDATVGWGAPPDGGGPAG